MKKKILRLTKYMLAAAMVCVLFAGCADDEGKGAELDRDEPVNENTIDVPEVDKVAMEDEEEETTDASEDEKDDVKETKEEQKDEAEAELNEEKKDEQKADEDVETVSDGTYVEKNDEGVSQAVIQPGQYPIMGASPVTVDQMVRYYKSSNKTYPAEALGKGGAPDIETFCQIYYEESTAEGVRPEVAFAQAMKETGWLQYGGDSKIEQFNFAGLGTTGGGVQGEFFPDVRTGVRAQVQHLKAYASEQDLNQACVDTRYRYVTKGCAPYVEWLGQKENPEGYGWATAENYGYSIVDMIHVMRSY